MPKRNATVSSPIFKTLECVGFPKHGIDACGDLWSATKKWKDGRRWKKLRRNSWGGSYRTVTLTYRGVEKTFGVHVLMLIVFVGRCPSGMQACHEDGNPTNNHVTNLRWDTPLGNQRDRQKHGTHNKGTRNGRATLIEDDIREIRRLYATGKFSQSQIGRMFDKGQDQISGIVLRKTWRHVK